LNKYNREWTRANPAAVRRSKRRWKKQNGPAIRHYRQRWRKKNKAPFCLICGEERAVDWAHIIPVNKKGPTLHWNLFPLCSTHHRCYDRHVLTEKELSFLTPYIQAANEHFMQHQKPGADSGD